MRKLVNRGRLRPSVIATMVALQGVSAAAWAQAQEPAADPWKVDIYYENDTRFRGKDATGKRVGLSKLRNTLQMEADRKSVV